MNKTTLISLALGLVVVSVFIGLVILKQRGSTPRVAGEITAVRTLGMDESSAVAIVDFRVTNTSRYPLIVGGTDMSVVDAKGETRQGQIISASDIHRLFELFPAIGIKMGEPLIIKTRIAPQASFSGMLAARFDLPKTDLDARKKITVAITDVDGPVSEISRR